MKNKFLKTTALFVGFSVIFFAGCKTINQPSSVIAELDYSDKDILSNEISNIKKLLQKEPVKAMWRASFISESHPEVLADCITHVEGQLDSAIEQKEYFDAIRLLHSLESVGYKDSKNYGKTVATLVNNNIPGSDVPASKLPKNISDCINATVTVWVDKGFKVQNGAGYADIVIGSGFFIDRRGYLITNHHVIEDLVNPKYEGFSRLYVKLPSDPDTKIPAKVIGYDSTMDLALLKVEIEPDYIFSLGSSKALSVGDRVSAIGTPIGLEGTLTSGIISSINRKLTTMGTVFQLDAAVNSGNSGGPLIDTNRNVQAVVFAGMLQYQGLNFAIPVEYLKQELPLLYNGGSFQHCWISCYGHTLKNKGVSTGIEVQYVMPGGSAHFAGIREGDVILSVGENKVTSIEEFQLALMKYLPETIVEISYKNTNDEMKTVSMYLEKRPESPSVNFFESDLLTDSFIPLYGIKLVHSSTTNKKSYTITKVIKGSYADEMGFSEGDPVEVLNVEVDNQNKYILSKIYIKRRKKGFIDISMIIGSSFDSPYYF